MNKEFQERFNDLLNDKRLYVLRDVGDLPQRMQDEISSDSEKIQAGEWPLRAVGLRGYFHSVYAETWWVSVAELNREDIHSEEIPKTRQSIVLEMLATTF